MPRCLSAEQVRQLIAACDGDTNARRARQPNVTLTVYAHLFDNDHASAAVAIAAVLR
jgi:hypothetical protein